MKSITRLILLAAISLLVSCEGERPMEVIAPEGEGRMEVHLVLPKLATENVVRVEAVVEGIDFTAIRQDLTITGNKATGTIENIPAGTDRRFTLNAYDAEDNLLYTGSAVSDVIADQTVQVKITMRRVGQPQGPTLAYVLNKESGNILVLDTQSNHYAASIPLGNTPEDLVFSSMDYMTYVLDGTFWIGGNWGYSNTSKIHGIPSNHTIGNLLELSEVRTGDTGRDRSYFFNEGLGKSQGIAVSPDGTELCVTRSYSDQVTVVDAIEWKNVADVFTEWRTVPADVVASKDGRFWLVVCELDNFLR